MRKGYFDCFAGASGDMIVGAFLDAGLDFELLRSELSRLPLSDYTVKAERVCKNGIAGTRFIVECVPEKTHRHLETIEGIIKQARYEPEIEKRALGIFRLLAEAEASIHDIPVEKVHFHEVGAVDSIIDITAAAIGSRLLEIDEFISSPLPMGSGFTESAHGTLPLPAPAVVRILKDVPVYDPGIKGELVTPTGAAVIKYLASGFGGSPQMKIVSDGFGAGTKDFGIPNLLRIIIGEVHALSENECGVLSAETNIDDMNPEFYSFVIEQLLAAGAKDAFVIPCLMKKGRPGSLLKIIFNEKNRKDILAVLFRETSTAGVRIYKTERDTLSRKSEETETEFGRVRVKRLSTHEGEEVTVSPEFEDCRAAALMTGASLKSVYNAALLSASGKKGSASSQKKESVRGMIHLYTGRGKGKTTAALGLVLRAAGRGMNSKIIRFMKNRDSGELFSLTAFGDRVQISTFGAAGFTFSGNEKISEAHGKEAGAGFEEAKAEVSRGDYGLIVLDEIITAFDAGLLTEEMILDVIKAKADRVELVLTGRGASEKITAAADLVTEMKEVKHYFDKGLGARRGIEF